jgi:hypothetical protein
VTTFKAAFFEEFTFARIGKLAWSLPLRLCGLSSYWTVAQSLEFKPQYCQKEKKVNYYWIVRGEKEEGDTANSGP